jgi:hypothetical protein
LGLGMMDAKKFPLPPERGYDKAYALSYQMASARLADTANVPELCQRAGVQCEPSDEGWLIALPYLGRRYRVRCPEVEVSALESEAPSLREKLLMLHYLITAKGTSPTGRWITFRELPEGNVYFPTFNQRAVRPVLDRFSKAPEELIKAAATMGGRKVEQGDVAVSIDAFPRVPVTFVIWRGDAELPPQGNIVFDANIADYLPTEDITVLCETIAWRLVRSAPA